MRILSVMIQFLVVGAAMLLSACSTSPLAGGNSSQTGNAGIAMTASRQSISGATAAGAHVSVFDQNYLPYVTPSGYCDSTVADDSGRFAFSSAQERYVNLYVNDLSLGRAGFIHRIPLFADSLFSDTIDSLKQPGFIAGAAIDTAGTIFPLSYMFIKGSPFYCVTKNNGDFLLGPLPAGTYMTGMFANFKVTDVQTGAIAQMFGVRTDSTKISVFADSTSQWHW